MRVLVVEDEQLLADAVATGLRREAMAVDVVYDGAAALERVGVNDYDVVVLDRDLPLVHGDDVCRKIIELGMPTRSLTSPDAVSISTRVGMPSSMIFRQTSSPCTSGRSRSSTTTS